MKYSLTIYFIYVYAAYDIDFQSNKNVCGIRYNRTMMVRVHIAPMRKPFLGHPSAHVLLMFQPHLFFQPILYFSMFILQLVLHFNAGHFHCMFRFELR